MEPWLAIPATALMVFAPSLPIGIIGYAFAQMIIIMGSPQSFAGIQMITPSRHRGFVSATYLAIATLAAYGLGPTVIGLCSDHIFASPSAGLGYALFIVVVCVGSLGLLAGRIANRGFATATGAAETRNATPFPAPISEFTEGARPSNYRE